LNRYISSSNYSILTPIASSSRPLWLMVCLSSWAFFLLLLYIWVSAYALLFNITPSVLASWFVSECRLLWCFSRSFCKTFVLHVSHSVVIHCFWCSGMSLSFKTTSHPNYLLIHATFSSSSAFCWVSDSSWV
jgi:hypothetical protein